MEQIMEELNKNNIGTEIDLFSKHTDSIGSVLVDMVVGIQELSKKTKESLQKFEDEKCKIEILEVDKKRRLIIPNEHYSRWKKLSRRHEHYELSKQLLPRSLLVSLISQFDAYLGRLLRVIFLRKPEILNSSEKNIF